MAVGAFTSRTDRTACAAERSLIVRALTASAASNERGEYPPVAGGDGLDAVRADGLLEWEPEASHWRYDMPVMNGRITDTNLVRTNVDRLSEADCPA